MSELFPWLGLVGWLICGMIGAYFLKPTDESMLLAFALGPITLLIAALDRWIGD